MTEDTISQIATPHGAGGIGIIRVSGGDALGVAQRVFRPAAGGTLGDMAPYTARYGHITAADGSVIDECILLYMRAPHSYTGEDTAELQCHGGAVVLREVLLRTWEAGARPAEAGEFTKRAFLHGRLDLARAEGVMELIAAKSTRAARAARERLAGAFSHAVTDIRTQILGAVAHIEAGIDFPEDDIPAASAEYLAAEIDAASAAVRCLLAGADTGRILREGVKTVIVGRPNVGKSSLLNALLGMERAIVTDVPGTTRDIIEEEISVAGIPLRLLDTAGLRTAEDAVEQIGIARTEQHLTDAELILAVFDASEPLTAEDHALLTRLSAASADTIILCSKEDRPSVLSAADFAAVAAPVLRISAQEGTGLDALREEIAAHIVRREGDLSDGALPNKEREIEALRRAEAHLAAAAETLAAGLGTDFVSIDLRAAYDILGEILGETVDTDLIDRIFSEFCIGK
ncbi:tRNA uridine-5-carboxymethylaminomethyl(34) synthesis GTPase MnmE [Selenomonas sp. oral taxon 478]|uniref:tRNA uridine-5-carboxymethylaminomethyl(34) synthesis GTPase MnmE n=1 Tax=Selenomonas sp. oral taxon 478 TaxID=712538 RepID=UPI00067A19DC|nr:tRNA uridine-5-carboxymethylaminomethyl(34) synthesis GTPase MnmE [Selenomonas sp. oral taxon 478]AKT53714.1 tRNA modification GTPase MnmE [Selenomonas sp. oral taxon 478]